MWSRDDLRTVSFVHCLKGTVPCSCTHHRYIQRCPLKSGSNLFADLVQMWQLLCHWINHKLFVRLTVPKRLVSLFLFTQAFTEHWSDLPPASLNYHRIIIFIIMVLWHCTNLVTFIMVMIIIISRWFLVCDKHVLCTSWLCALYRGPALFQHWFSITFPWPKMKIHNLGTTYISK